MSFKDAILPLKKSLKPQNIRKISGTVEFIMSIIILHWKDSSGIIKVTSADFLHFFLI